MSVSRDEVHRIAELASLAVDPADADDIARDLSAILGLIQQLEGSEEMGVAPHRHGPAAAPLRDDRPVRSGLDGSPEDFAAEFAEGFFLAPRPPGVGTET